MGIKNDKNIPYGHLNPISLQYTPNKSELNINVYSFFETLKDITRERFTPDSLAGNTEYKAIVLKTLDETQLGGNPQLSSLTEEFGGKNTQIRVVAKIPELHSHLPDPRDENDFEILSMYPIFYGAKNLTAPVAGELVRVTFQNIYTQAGPVYLGSITGEGAVVGLSYETTSGKEVFASGAKLRPSNPIGKEDVQDVGFVSSSRGGKLINQIVIHESLTADRAGAIRTLLTKKASAPHGASVHYIVDPSGGITQHLPLAVAGVHADGLGTNHNDISIGIEVINVYYVNEGANKNTFLEGLPWAHRGKYLIPPLNQLEAVYKLIKYLTSGNAAGIPTDKYALEMKFPAATIIGNEATFTWGKVRGLEVASGIMAHGRWPPHADGEFIEHYCFARYMGYEPETAYSATNVAAAVTAATQKLTTKLKTGLGV